VKGMVARPLQESREANKGETGNEHYRMGGQVCFHTGAKRGSTLCRFQSHDRARGEPSPPPSRASCRTSFLPRSPKHPMLDFYRWRRNGRRFDPRRFNSKLSRPCTSIGLSMKVTFRGPKVHEKNPQTGGSDPRSQHSQAKIAMARAGIKHVKHIRPQSAVRASLHQASPMPMVFIRYVQKEKQSESDILQLAWKADKRPSTAQTHGWLYQPGGTYTGYGIECLFHPPRRNERSQGG